MGKETLPIVALLDAAVMLMLCNKLLNCCKMLFCLKFLFVCLENYSVIKVLRLCKCWARLA